MDEDVTFRMLGPTSVDGRPLVVGARPQAMFVALLLQHGRSVSVDRLAAAVWDGEPPRSQASNLRTYASLLRRKLGRHGNCLLFRDGGYVLAVSSKQCDVAAFRCLARCGHQAYRGGDATTAASLLIQALTCWRAAQAAPGVVRNGPLRGWLDALDEDRLRAEEDLCAALIAIDEPRSALGRLHEVLTLDPLRSRAWLLRMQIHQRLGEPAAVADCYRQACRLFREELGIAPAPALSQFYAAVLDRQ